MLRRKNLGPAPAPFPTAEALPAYVAATGATQHTKVAASRCNDDTFELADEKSALTHRVLQPQVEEPVASASTPKLRSPEELHRRAHERATEVILSSLQALAARRDVMYSCSLSI